MRIAVDVMGGDHGCGVVVEGVRLALAKDRKIATLYLVGDQPTIESCLREKGLKDDRIQIVHASEVLTMEDKPIDGLRRKKDCSIARVVELVKMGRRKRLSLPATPVAL